MYQNFSISLIVPCYNEAPRIPHVLKTAIKSKYLDEIIVIDDGSTDNSVAVVLEFDGKVKLLRNKRNRGKADAVFNGIKHSSSELVFLIDADLQGLKPNHLDQSIAQFVDSQLDMLLLPTETPSTILNHIENLIGSNIVVTGQRIIRKSKILPHLQGGKKLGFGLEMYLNRLAEIHNWKTDVILWKKSTHPPTHVLKSKKYGFAQGIKNEFKMLSQIGSETNILEYLLHYRKYIIHKSKKPIWLKLAGF